ncbi:hypothetical protein EDC04DRAFT_2607057 [Pisolithus marmoratus]|nr:hypothetical protein EDC04DRAFT_2607057 [Pisolithus marmoratus]
MTRARIYVRITGEGESSAGVAFYPLDPQRADTWARQHMQVGYAYREDNQKTEVHVVMPGSWRCGLFATPTRTEFRHISRGSKTGRHFIVHIVGHARTASPPHRMTSPTQADIEVCSDDASHRR